MFSPPVGKEKRTTESSSDDSSTVNKTSTMRGNKEEDPNNLVSMLAGFEKDINQQLDESTNFDSINKAEMIMIIVQYILVMLHQYLFQIL